MSVREIAKKIRSMRIRGALDIAIAAAGALALEVNSSKGSTAEILKKFKKSGRVLKNARPTAVSLPNAVDYCLYLAEKNRHLEARKFRKKTHDGIRKFVREQERALEKIAEIGSRIIEKNDVILTHCNSDTVTAILKRAWDDGKKIRVIVTETRPRYQGYLTAKQLSRHGISVTIVVDSAAYLAMKEFGVSKVLVGADTVYVSGEVINKIGTSQIALAAHSLGIKFIVATECIKFSPRSIFGETVEIEYREPSEFGLRLRGVKILNPAFDITEPAYVDLIITEEGAIPPQAAYQVLKEKFGWEL